MIVTVYGLPGSGKTSALRILASELNFDYIEEFHVEPSYHKINRDFLMIKGLLSGYYSKHKDSTSS